MGLCVCIGMSRFLESFEELYDQLSIIKWCIKSNRVPLQRTREENALRLVLVLLEEVHTGNQMRPLCSLAGGVLCMISVY